MDRKQQRFFGSVAVKVAIVVALVGAVGGVVYVKGQQKSAPDANAGKDLAANAG